MHVELLSKSSEGLTKIVDLKRQNGAATESMSFELPALKPGSGIYQLCSLELVI